MSAAAKTYTPRLHTEYQNRIKKAMQDEFGYKKPLNRVIYG